MKKIEIDEYKKILLEILVYIDKVCRDNNIKYSLIGGSLIGAIRHHGIIPWDDDIDIILMPKEYDKLIQILKQNCDERYKLLHFTTNNTYYLPYAKVIDSKTSVIEENSKFIQDYGIFVDILKYTYLPNHKLLRRLYLLRYQYMLSIIHGFAKSSTEKNIFKKIRTSISQHKNINKYLIKFDKYSNKYISKSIYMISNWPIYGLKKEIQRTCNMLEYMDIEFDGINAMITKNYDRLLRTTFNNYMKLPPIEKRVTHHNIKAWWK